MGPAAVLVHLAATTLGAAGVGKLLAPDAARGALDAVRPGAGRLAPAVGVAEIAIGVAAVVAGGRVTAAALAVTYAALLWFNGQLRRRAPGVPCGCFGSTAAPPGPAHIGVDLVLGAAAAIAIVSPTPSIANWGLGVWTVPYLKLLAVATYLVVLIGTTLDEARSWSS